MAETERRREKQRLYNEANGITPESVRRDIKDILDSPYERADRVTVDAGVAEGAKAFVGSNFQATLKDLEAKMREAAQNLEFETAARLRDEIKRLKTLDLEFAADALSSGKGEETASDVAAEFRKAARAEKAREMRKRR